MNPYVITGDMGAPDFSGFFKEVGDMTDAFYSKYFQTMWTSFFRDIYRIFFWVTLGILVLDIILLVFKQIAAGKERTLAKDLGKNTLAVILLIVGYLTLLLLIGFAFYLIGILILVHLFLGTSIDEDSFSDEDEEEETD